MNPRSLSIVGLGMVVLAIMGVFMSSFSDSDTTQTVQSVEQKGIPLTALIAEMSRETFPDQKFFLIDGSLIFVERTGHASDYSYHHILFDKNKNELCSFSDNVMGPMKQCSDESQKELFEIITNNLDKEDLGLGAGRVELVYEIHTSAQ